MAGARLREAMSDLAETIRRVFKSPASHGVSVGYTLGFPGQIPPLGASVGLPFEVVAATARSEDLLGGGLAVPAVLAFAPSVAGEPGWAAWETGGWNTRRMVSARSDIASLSRAPAMVYSGLTRVWRAA